MALKEKSEICKICGKTFDKQGYGGHMWGVHNVRVGLKAYAQEAADRFHKIVPMLDDIQKAYPELKQKIVDLEQRLKIVESKLTIIK